MKEIEGIREVIDRDGGRITQDLVLLMKNLEKIYSGLDEEKKGSFCEELEHVLEESFGGQKLLFCTFLCVLTLDRKYLHLTQEIVLTDPSLTVENCYYLYQRLMRILFVHSELADHDAILNQWKILRNVVDSYAYALENDLGQDLSYIPRNNRNKGVVIVLIGQFLAASHAPSGIALDRCRILQKRLNKRVMLINVADTLTPVGAVPTWMGGVGSYIPQYSSMDSIEWEGGQIPYFQCDQNMPNPEVVRLLLNLIRDRKPEYIIDIGNCGLMPGLAARIVPVLTIDTASALSGFETQVKALPRPLGEADKEILAEMGVAEDRVISQLFTFSFPKEKGEPISRDALGLDGDDHVITFVGNRLNHEMTMECWRMLCSVNDPKLRIILIGDFPEDQMNEVIKAFPALEGKIRPCGRVPELRTYYRICDLFVNPVRNGGGTSAALALSVGLPVLTTRYGDVYYNVGDDFAVERIEDMAGMIKKYFTDPAFYSKQAAKSIERAEKLQDSEGEFCKLIHAFEERIG